MGENVVDVAVADLVEVRVVQLVGERDSPLHVVRDELLGVTAVLPEPGGVDEVDPEGGELAGEPAGLEGQLVLEPSGRFGRAGR